MDNFVREFFYRFNEDFLCFWVLTLLPGLNYSLLFFNLGAMLQHRKRENSRENEENSVKTDDLIQI